MTPRTLVISIVGTACVAAAGAGGYLAMRYTPASSAAPAQGAPSAVVPAAPVEQAAPAPVPPVASPARESMKTTAREAEPSRPASHGESRPFTPPAAAAPPATDAAAVVPPATAATPAAPAPVPDPPAAATAPEPAVMTTPDAPKRTFDEVTVTTDSVIGIRLDAPISTETAKVEDRIAARVTRNVTVDDRVAIPAGTRLEGTVTSVERGGKFKERARLGVQFTAMILPDNTRVPLRTEPIYRDGDSPTGEATSKIGASAVVGALLGAVIGGKKGAAIGTTAGAAGGTAAVMAGGVNEAVLPAGTPLTVRLTAPVTVLIERDQIN